MTDVNKLSNISISNIEIESETDPKISFQETCPHEELKNTCVDSKNAKSRDEQYLDLSPSSSNARTTLSEPNQSESKETKKSSIDEKEPKTLTTYVLQVSGGAFPVQLALLCEVYEAKRILCNGKFSGQKDYAPDLVLAASGGNVAAYVALAGDWSPDGIERTIRKIDTKMFAQKWLPDIIDFFPQWIYGIIKGSMYKEGYGAEQLFSTLFTSTSIRRTEIWTGTYNVTCGRAQFFCNLDEKSSIICQKSFGTSSLLYGCMPLEYTSGDVKLLSKVSIASASIPMVVAEHDIGGIKYADGGAAYATPLPPFSDEIYRICTGHNQMKIMGDTMIPLKPKCKKCQKMMRKRSSREKNISKKKLQLIYFCCQDMEVCSDDDFYGRFKKIASIISSIVAQDRAAAITLLQKISAGRCIEYKLYTKVTTNSLADIFRRLNNISHYVMCLFPSGAPKIDMFNFTHRDISSVIKDVRSSYNVHLWFIE